LVSRGLISRKASSNDRRQVELSVTAKGKSILDVARDGTQAEIAEKLVGLSARERNTLYAALTLMSQVLGRSGIESDGIKTP